MLLCVHVTFTRGGTLIGPTKSQHLYLIKDRDVIYIKSFFLIALKHCNISIYLSRVSSNPNLEWYNPNLDLNVTKYSFFDHETMCKRHVYIHKHEPISCLS